MSYRQTDKLRDRQIDRQTDTQTDRQTERQIDRQTDRQTDLNEPCCEPHMFFNLYCGPKVPENLCILKYFAKIVFYFYSMKLYFKGMTFAY